MRPSPRGSRPVAQLAAGDRVIVVGAGPAGSTAAYVLAKQGVARITVLEADEIVGGIARTAQYKGFRFDIGGHRFFTKLQPVEELWREIPGPEFISVPRLSRIYNNQDHSMLAAMLSVANMQGGSYDPWDTNTGLEYHEEQRVDAPGGNRGSRV